MRASAGAVWQRAHSSPIDRLERGISSLTRGLDWRTATALAFTPYLLLGLLVPLALDLGRIGFVYLNILGAGLSTLLLLAWLVGIKEELDAFHLLEWRTNLRQLTSREFEALVGEVMRRRGWAVEHVGGDGTGDGNIDLRLRKGSEVRLVQCKAWRSWAVGVAEVRELGGTLLRERLQGRNGILVSLTSFNAEARQEAEQMGLQLVDGVKLKALLDEYVGDTSCPKCGSEMRLDRSRHGLWLRCRDGADGCRGKRDLAPPALAGSS